MLYNNLPLIYMDVDESVDGINYMSLVEYPAVDVDYITFDDGKKNMIAKYSLQEEKHILNGVALIPDYPIYRCSPSGDKYYNIFTKEAIERIVTRFFEDGKNTSVNLEHAREVEGCVIFESYLINHQRGICPKEFDEYPDNTWIISMKINNDRLWQDIKEGKYKGFSIEGILSPSFLPNKGDMTLDSVEKLMEYLK